MNFRAEAGWNGWVVLRTEDGEEREFLTFDSEIDEDEQEVWAEHVADLLNNSGEPK